MKENKKTSINILIRFLPFLKPFKLLISGCVFISLINISINMTEAYFVKNIIDLVVKKDFSNLLKIIIFMGIVIITGIIISYLMKYIYGLFSSLFLKNLRFKLMEHIQTLPVFKIENKKSGDLISRLNSDIQTAQNFFTGDFLSLFIMMISFIVATAYMVYIKWDLFLVSIVITPPSLYLLNKIQKHQKEYSKKSQEYLGKAASTAKDAIGGIYISKAFNIGNYLLDKYKENIGKSLEYNIIGTKIGVWAAPIHVTLRTTTRIICVTYGAYLSLKGLITPGDLFSFLYLMGFVVWPLAFLTDFITNIKTSMGAAERIIEIFDEQSERKNGSSFDNYNGKDIIRFENVNFSYIEGVKILNDLSFEVERGKTIALVGQSGCGKSTIIKLLCNFYESCDGIIQIYEKNIKEWNLSALRSQISLVSQDIFLYPASVYENISYGKTDATYEEIINASEISCASEFILSLPKGYDTFIGERGIKLSGGQRQRIALARAFLKNSPIILFDEPTSALDTHTEKLIQEAINKLMNNKTVIIVAHRISTIKDADEILVLDNGKIVEKGIHEELLGKDGKYKELYIKKYFKTGEEENC